MPHVNVALGENAVSKKFALIASALVVTYALPVEAQTCTGNCGTASPNGVVTSPPAFGPSYSYVSTVGGVVGAGQIEGVSGGTSGSQLVTSSFNASAGDSLNFFFNYVTSDGADFSDYAFAELLSDASHVAWLFTARTTTSGNTTPGFGLPANDSILTPSSTPIISGAPVWAQLGASSGDCFDAGCGYTGWIGSNYMIATDGTYQLRFGVTNIGDLDLDSGLAFAGVTVNDVPVGSVPEPTTWAMMLAGFGMIGLTVRRRQNVKSRVTYA
jgi:hypothetical protein